MANEEQLARLKRGVAEWNAWREAHRAEYVDLSGADLSQTYLSGADLFGANLIKANLQGAHLQGAHLQGAHLQNVDLGEAHLQRANLQRANLQQANLFGADLQGVHLQGAHLQEADIQGGDLRWANLREAILQEANLRMANLSESHLQQVDLQRAYLQRADLQGTYLRQANLKEAYLFEANLQGADLQQENFQGAHFQRTNLQRAHFHQTDLQGINLRGSFIGETTFAYVDLRDVEGLHLVEHSGPSTIGIDTLIASGGHIPEVFLRGCGVPDSWITYLPSLLDSLEPIQFYSCFISYTEKDVAFAKRLHECMRRENLRVWFASEDLKGGHKLRDQLHSAIQLYDKFLLILSDASMASDWVADELSHAYARERKEQRRILFPIGLNDFDSLKQWSLPDDDTGRDLAKEIRRYYIPDFSTWKDHDAFEASFARLLNDLKANDAMLPKL